MREARCSANSAKAWILLTALVLLVPSFAFGGLAPSFSTRHQIGSEESDSTVYVDFEITAATEILSRHIGPQLTSFGVAGALSDPVLEVYDASNELIDSFPVHLVTLKDNDLREIFVTHRDGQFCEEIGEISSPKLKDHFEKLIRLDEFPGPLVRFGVWPHGNRSALSITGDIDALTIWDFLNRLRGA